MCAKAKQVTELQSEQLRMHLEEKAEGDTDEAAAQRNVAGAHPIVQQPPPRRPQVPQQPFARLVVSARQYYEGRWSISPLEDPLATARWNMLPAHAPVTGFEGHSNSNLA